MLTLRNGNSSRAAISILALCLSACGAVASPSEAAPSARESEDGTETASTAPTLTASFEEANSFADPPAGSIEIVMTFGPKFEPEEATATAGTVTFFLVNDKGDGLPIAHNFLLGTAVDAPPLASSPVMGSGEAGILTVQDLEPGTYAYWCTIAGPDGNPHSHQGMVGTLTVTP